MTRAVLLTGAPGTGKSSVLGELTTLLEIDGVAFGALEAEQLGWGSPWLHGEPWLAQLSAVVRLQRDAGRRLFLIAATLESDQQLTAAVEAVDVDEVTSVLLTASPDMAGARVAAREPDTWPGKPALVEHARELASSMTALADVDIRLATDGRVAADVAEELYDRLRARLNPLP